MFPANSIFSQGGCSYEKRKTDSCHHRHHFTGCTVLKYTGMRHHRQYRNHENVQSFYLCHLRDPGTDLGLYVPIQTYAQEIIIFLLFL